MKEATVDESPITTITPYIETVYYKVCTLNSTLVYQSPITGPHLL